jgi:sugar phosphate isomerase/epimerase
MKSSITISLVPEAKGGPFVFWGDLAGSCAKAAELGFEAVEVFAPSGESLKQVKPLLAEHKLSLAAAGTGAGWVMHRLRLTDPDPGVREKARQFVGQIIDAAGSLGAPAIIGSMQGRYEGAVSREQALGWLEEGLNELGERAAGFKVPLLFEPLNRYETNMITSIEDGVVLLNRLATRNVKLLADMFHMNIEERSLAEAIHFAGSIIGHVHFVDSNRLAAGRGHIDLAEVVTALRVIEYQGYLSAEALAFPDSEAAARQTIESFNRYVRRIPPAAQEVEPALD